MKFDPECVRDILIAAEERTDGNSMIWMIPGPSETSTVPGLSAYPYKIAIYHIRQCVQSGLIEIVASFIDGSFEIIDLTDHGHQLLAKLRLPPAQRAWTNAKDSGLLASAGSLVQWALEIAGMLLK